MSKGYVCKNFTTNVFTYEKFDTPISVVGRLKTHISYWQSIGCSEHILNIINRGYVIPLTERVETVHLRNNKSSRDEPIFVRESIDELLDCGAIIECATKPFVINPLTVANKDGKLRLVIDMRHINPLIVKHRCKYDGHDVARQFLEKNGYMTVFNLKSGYHHIDVVESQQELLGFSYTDTDGNERYFKFLVLLFGLATAGYVFTKVLRELIKHWRGLNIRALAFLDDGLQANASENITRMHAIQIKGSLISARWVPHRTKSIWIPKQQISWLGFQLDLIKGVISVNADRLNRALYLIRQIMSKNSVHVKRLAKLKGMIASMERSHGDMVHLMTRFMNLAISETPTWNCHITLLPPVIRELDFWLKNIEKLNGASLFPTVSTATIEFSLYPDASNVGCTTVLTPMPNQSKLVVNRMFDKDKILSSSTERELLGVLHSITQLRHVLRGCSVDWFTDAQNVARIVKRGSKKPYLANIAIAIYHIVTKLQINLNVIWIPRDQNQEADFWSRVRDFDDWEVTKVWFNKICKYFDFKPTIDQFANFKNRKLNKFNSKFYHNRANAIDSFTQIWAEERNWVVPPVFLINKALDYCKTCKAEMVIVFPKWKSGVFWPKVMNLLNQESDNVLNSLVMGAIFSGGSTPDSIFSTDKWQGESMALNIRYQ